MYRAGIDVGGTFTDVVLMDHQGLVVMTHKVPSTPASPQEAVLQGLSEALEKAGAPPADLDVVAHGNTLGVNAVIQRRGAEVVLLTTAGFGDVLELARLRMSDPLALVPRRPRPMVPRNRVFEVSERTSAAGSVRQRLDVEQLRETLKDIPVSNQTAVAIAFLNSYANDANEKAARAEVQAAFPNLPVVTSSELWPEAREYERTLFTVMNAFLVPVMRVYYEKLRTALKDRGVRCRILIPRSSGGVMDIDEAGTTPIHTLLSGPAAGATGAHFFAKALGVTASVTLDMGGTSADVAFVGPEGLVHSTDNHVGELPVIAPTVDVSAIGAGGGSIVRVDVSGLIQVGPDSAGADPGPACYGRGGIQPTVTDAYLLCGYLNPENFLGGRLKLEPILARQAMEPIAARLGMTLESAASAVLQVAIANMAAELFPLMARRRVDPRETTLVAYGGAGPTIAGLLLQEMNLKQMVVPPGPGTLCALGAVISPFKVDQVRMVQANLEELGTNLLQQYYADLETEAIRWLEAQGVGASARQLIRGADVRYKGQPADLFVELSPEQSLTAESLRGNFEAQHHDIYGFTDPKAAVIVTKLRIAGYGRTNGEVQPRTRNRESDKGGQAGSRKLHFALGWTTGQILLWEDLQVGAPVSGPAVIESEDTSIVVPPGLVCTLHETGACILTRIVEA